ncbi:MAG: hypothetical protein GC162_10665 [Planctomycetes bacterium]|nr:hypothetical protein [Planctomycetota bacterium]
MHKDAMQKLTWAGLLGRWVEFAQSALALPDDAAGRTWREAVPEIIGLQALTMALSEAGELPADERALGIDRARVLIDRHTDRLTKLFAPGPLPAMLGEMIADACAAVRVAEAC